MHQKIELQLYARENTAALNKSIMLKRRYLVPDQQNMIMANPIAVPANANHGKGELCKKRK
ncbi:hypothetical protein AC739_06700 [Planococcus glaciei]|nr:hypothetical protein AC739_06700 [Planococcus glaciei]